MNNTLKAVLSISFCFVLGSSGGLITINEIPGWYATLQKPSFNLTTRLQHLTVLQNSPN